MDFLQWYFNFSHYLLAIYYSASALFATFEIEAVCHIFTDPYSSYQSSNYAIKLREYERCINDC